MEDIHATIHYTLQEVTIHPNQVFIGMILVTEGQKPVVSVGERQGNDGVALLVKIMYI